MGGLSETSETVNVGNMVVITPAKQYTTYVTTTALDFSNVSGLKAYVATSTTSTAVKLTEVGAVPAQTPLVLMADNAGKAYSVSTTTPAATVQGNLLVAGDGTTEIGGTSRYDYVLKDGKFKRADVGTCDVGKAYLHLDSAPAAELILDFGDDATGIGDAVKISDKSEEIRDNYYNLNGQRVAQPAKGLYIVNGKKVIIK